MQTLFPKDRGKFYEEERIRFEIQEELKKEKNQKLAKGFSFGCLLVVLSVMGLFAAAYYSSKSKEIPVGSEVKLRSGGARVAVPVDLDAFNEYRHALGADNNETITHLVLAGRVILVDSGTKARTISDGPTLYKVKILEGRYAGETGYLEDTQITYTKAK